MFAISLELTEVVVPSDLQPTQTLPEQPPLTFELAPPPPVLQQDSYPKKQKKINRPCDYNYPQKCEFCSQVFLEKEMVRHKEAHPESFTLDCIPCRKFFKTKAAYDLHYNIHKIYHCIECKKDFRARKHYRSHMERIHKIEGERPRLYQCDTCQKTFKDKFVLNTHMTNKHSNIKKYKCPYENVCQYSTNNKTYLSHHVLNHTNSLFKCHICYRGFASDEQVQSHINKLHVNEPIFYKCDVCNKLSTSKGNLRQHQKTHENPLNGPQYQCQDCNKTFSLKSRLRKHQLTHQPTHKVSCVVCAKLLSKDSYRKHLKVHNGFGDSFLCEHCGINFSTNRSLALHKTIHTTPGKEMDEITSSRENTTHHHVADKQETYYLH